MNVYRLIASILAFAGISLALIGCGGAGTMDQPDPANSFKVPYSGGDILLGDPMAPGGGPGFIINNVIVTDDPNPNRTTANITAFGNYFTANAVGSAQFVGTITHDGVITMTAKVGDLKFVIRNAGNSRLTWMTNAHAKSAIAPPGGPSQWVGGDVIVTEGNVTYPSAHIELW